MKGSSTVLAGPIPGLESKHSRKLQPEAGRSVWGRILSIPEKPPAFPGGARTQMDQCDVGITECQL